MTDKLAIRIEAPDPAIASSYRGDLWRWLAPRKAWRLCSYKQVQDHPYIEEIIVEVPDAIIAVFIVGAPTDDRVKVLSKRKL
jgi:hypothetical protein